MTSIAIGRLFRGGDRRDPGRALLAFAGGGTAESESSSFWTTTTPSSSSSDVRVRTAGRSFRDGGACATAPPSVMIPPPAAAGLALAPAHRLVRGGGSVAVAGGATTRVTTAAQASVPGGFAITAVVRTPPGRGCEVMGAIRTMSSNKKSKTKRRGRGRSRRRKQGERGGGGTRYGDESKSSIIGASRRKRAAEDRLRGVMKSYRAMIDGQNEGADSSHEGGDDDGGGHNVVIPPTQIVATASPHAWIAASAVDVATEVHPDLLFAHGGIPPKSFRSARFEYCSPKSFGHELPEFSIPEVAFLGRSNVGKSSLINALTGRRDLARVSKRPGRTQQVNCFALLLGAGGDNRSQGTPARKARGESSSSASAGGGASSFHPSEATAFLVDLPGFGYAVAPDEAVDAWQRTTMDFLLQRRDHGTMTRVYLLVDGRHGATPLDLTVMDWFDEAELPYTVVLTKIDAAASGGVGVKLRHVNDLCLRFHGRLHGGGVGGGGDDDDDGGGGVYMGPVVHLTSARTGDGMKDLMWAIDGDFVAYYEMRGAGGEGAVVDSGKKPGW